MPNGPLFSNQPVDSSVQSCPRQAKGAGSKKWGVDGILKILCKNDKKVVEQLSKTTVKTADQVYFDDPYFDGKKWTTKKFIAGGTSYAPQKLITILSGASNEEAADTIYHEIWHQNQPAGMKWPEPAEDDAYYNTELWTIERGLPGNPSLRTKGATGKVVPDKKAIRDHVQREYPGPPPPMAGKPQPIPVAADKKKNLTQVVDPVTLKKSWRPSQKGDTFSADEEKLVNPKIINKSAWKCP